MPTSRRPFRASIFVTAMVTASFGIVFLLSVGYNCTDKSDFLGEEIVKKLYLIGGTMGVGKTSVSQCMKQELPNAVFLDGDWCWDANPFQITQETKEMVIDNICYLLNRFVQCSAYENIIFCWVMHEQSIIDTILNKVNTTDCVVKIISLMAMEETLAERIMRDIDSGSRDTDVLERSIARIPLYQSVNSVKVETDGKTVHEIAEEIIGA